MTGMATNWKSTLQIHHDFTLMASCWWAFSERNIERIFFLLLIVVIPVEKDEDVVVLLL